MAGIYTPFFTEILSYLPGVWPEAVLPGQTPAEPSNVWTSVQAFRKNFEAEAQNSQLGLAGAVEPPYIVISVGQFKADPDYSLGYVRAYIAPIKVFYVMSPLAASNTTGVAGTQDAVSDKLQLLGTFFDTYDQTYGQGFQNFQVGPGRGMVDSSESNAWNAYVLGQNKGELIGGHVVWDPGWYVNGSSE